MNIWNLSTAVQDTDLYGESLMVPLRQTVKAYRNAFSIWPADLTISRKVTEIFKRSMLTAVSLLSIPASPLALLGISVKWIDLFFRNDQLVHKGSAVGVRLSAIYGIYSRLGDRTVAYLNTKYVANELGLPVHFIPFKGCDNFAFSQMENMTGPRYYKKVVHLKNAEQIKSLKEADKTNSVLYLLPFFPHTRDLSKESSKCSYINYTIDWQKFRPKVRELLHVIKPHKKFNIPRRAYTIALHIRDGGNFDDNNTKTIHPLKLPCMNFYIRELKRVLTSGKIPKYQPVYIHIFTDSCDPRHVHEQFQKSLEEYQGDRNFTLSYTPKEEVNLTDDIANMSRFQCMIRADSNLSGPIAEGSETTELEIYPSGFQMDQDFKKISIAEVKMVERRSRKPDNIKVYRTDYSKKVTGWLPNWFFNKLHDYLGVYRANTN